MSVDKFNITFDGKVLPGTELEAVKANVGKLFKLAPEKVEKLFTGAKVKIKAGVDKDTGMKYRALMRKAGAICYMEPEGGPASAKPAAQGAPQRAPIGSKPIQSKPIQSKPIQAKPKQAAVKAHEPAQPKTESSNKAVFAPSGDQPAKKPPESNADIPESAAAAGGDPFDTSHLDDLVMPAGSDIGDVKPMEHIEVPDIAHLDMAEVGANVLEEEYKPPPPPPAPDVSGIDVAEVGADMGQAKDDRPPVEVDVSGMSMAEVGADVLEEKPKGPPPVNPDISGLSMAEVGADVLEEKPEGPAPVNPDISGISLED